MCRCTVLYFKNGEAFIYLILYELLRSGDSKYADHVYVVNQWQSNTQISYRIGIVKIILPIAYGVSAFESSTKSFERPSQGKTSQILSSGVIIVCDHV